MTRSQIKKRDSAPQKFEKFIPLSKVDEAQRLVYGIVTAQIPDQSQEICDFNSTVPFYEKLATHFDKVTDGKSCAPLRYMHQLEAIGVGKSMDFLPELKQIKMSFKVVDDKAWEKVQEGVLTGFSHGGEIAKSWKAKWTSPDGETKTYKWYTAIPGEISLVDNPCLSEATFEYVKTDGSIELRKFKKGEDCQCPCEECITGDCGHCSCDPCDCFKCQCAQHTGTLSSQDLRDVKELIVAAIPTETHALVSEQDIQRIADTVVTKMKDESAPDKLSAIIEKTADVKTKRVAGEDLVFSAFAYVGDKKDPSTWKLPLHFSTDTKSAAHVRNALSRFDQTQGIPSSEKKDVKAKIIAAAKKYGINVAEDGEKCFKAKNLWTMASPDVRGRAEAAFKAARDSGAGLAKAVESDMAKALYDVKELIDIMQALASMENYLNWERDIEEDASTAPETVHQLLEDAASFFLDLAAEEVQELVESTPGGQAVTGEKAMTQTQIQKMMKSAGFLTHMGKALECCKAHHDGMMAVHKAHETTMNDMHKAHHDAMHKATSLEHAKTMATDHFGKATAAHSAHVAKLAGMHKAHMDEMNDHLGKAIEHITGDTDGGTITATEVIKPDGQAHSQVPAEVIKASDLDAKISAGIEAGLNKFFGEMEKAITSTTDEAPPAGGVGDRNNVVNMPGRPMNGMEKAAARASGYTTDKANDNGMRNGQQPNTTGMTTTEMTEIAKKAYNGDDDAMTALARTIKVASHEVPAHVAAAASARGMK